MAEAEIRAVLHTGNPEPTPNWYIFGGNAAFVIVSLTLGLSMDAPFDTFFSAWTRSRFLCEHRGHMCSYIYRDFFSLRHSIDSPSIFRMSIIFRLSLPWKTKMIKTALFEAVKAVSKRI